MPCICILGGWWVSGCAGLTYFYFYSPVFVLPGVFVLFVLMTFDYEYSLHLTFIILSVGLHSTIRIILVNIIIRR